MLEINKYLAKGIIETGANSNGYYQKYADGTLLQRGTSSCPSGIGYADITFPVAFIDSNYTMIANHKYTGGSDYGGSGQLRNITSPQSNDTSTAYIYSYLYDGTIANYIRNVQYVAYGKWK